MEHESLDQPSAPSSVGGSSLTPPSTPGQDSNSDATPQASTAAQVLANPMMQAAGEQGQQRQKLRFFICQTYIMLNSVMIPFRHPFVACFFSFCVALDSRLLLILTLEFVPRRNTEVNSKTRIVSGLSYSLSSRGRVFKDGSTAKCQTCRRKWQKWSTSTFWLLRFLPWRRAREQKDSKTRGNG